MFFVIGNFLEFILLVPINILSRNFDVYTLVSTIIETIALLFVLRLLFDLIPPIETTEKGIIIESLWKNRQLLWEDIQIIKPLQIIFSKVYFIGSKKLPLIHLIIGLLFAREMLPVFFLASYGKNKELIAILLDKKKSLVKNPAASYGAFSPTAKAALLPFLPLDIEYISL